MTLSPAIKILNQAGQSIWYDNLSRDVLISGELKRLIASGVSGLTSNPTIFKKAIADSSNYDLRIAELNSLSSGDAEAICETLMIEDVGAAADLLKPNYTSSNGADGYASIEVSPFLARDTRSTVEAAKRIWSRLGRPNVMIKIPATKEGLPAIREVLAEGINVNVTLIFSVARYGEVIEAFLSGLEDRSKKGLPISGIASVASFFVSRLDSIVEKSLGKLAAEGKISPADLELFFGKPGIANSKLAYELFGQRFSDTRFGALKAKGAQAQRALWASTSVKNPKLPELLYVEALGGKDTVNTLPPNTLTALIGTESVSPALSSGLAEAKSCISALSSKVPFESLLSQLETEGVESFAQSYRELLESIQTKAKALNAPKAARCC